MRRTLRILIAALALPALVLPAVASSGVTGAVTTTRPAAEPTYSHRLPGTDCRIFDKDNYWHADVRRLPVNKRSTQWLGHMQAGSRNLHPDFGPAYGEQPVPYGIPVTVVDGGPKVPVKFGYARESDEGRYPLSSRTRIEGGKNADGDRHAIVVDSSTCTLYETFDTRYAGGRWTAGSGAVWSLRSNKLRPNGWTSADAAGLPILPGLLRYDEVRRGRVDHAIRFTTDLTDRKFRWPARHQAGSVRDASYPPMGARFRLKKSFPTKGYSRETRVVLKAMKRYGLVLADNGSPWFFQGTADNRWGSKLLDQLKSVPAKKFEAVDTKPLKARTGSATARSR